MSESRVAQMSRPARRYLRAPVPIHFPTDETVPETGIHLELRTALYQCIELAFGDRAIVGSEQFVYWDATDPRQCLSPDVMVWVGAPHTPVPLWKVWERGAPHVAVEVISASDARDRPWQRKLERYRRCGVRELIRFDPDDTARPLSLWDRVDEDLVERSLDEPESTLCDALGVYWCVHRDERLGPMLRLARDAAGAELLPTLAEARRTAAMREREAETRRREAETRRREAEARRREAEARVHELEAELAALKTARKD